MTTNVTSITARGFVVADFDTATFSLSFNEFAPKAKAAKLTKEELAALKRAK